MATGETVIRKDTIWNLVGKEMSQGVLLALFVCFITFLRVIFFAPMSVETEFRLFLFEAFGLCLSLFLIIMAATLVGTLLPIFFAQNSIDPAHSAPAIQVVMDLMGVFLICLVFVFVV